MDICNKCGKSVAIGQWPWCPHSTSYHISMQDDTVTGGARWFQNLGRQPVWIETKTELKRELGERGLRLRESDHYNRDDKSPWATRTRLR